MKAALFYYDNFAEFEVALSLLLLKDANWVHIGLENRTYRSLEGQNFCISHDINQVDPSQLDLLLIPGGDSQSLFESIQLKEFILSVLNHGGLIAGICGGAELLAGLGLLNGLHCTGGTSGVSIQDIIYPFYRNAFLVDDYIVITSSGNGTIITAQGQAYAEFAAILHAKTLGDDTRENVNSTLKWLKNQRDREPYSPYFLDSNFILPFKGWAEVNQHVKVSIGHFNECNCTLIVSHGEAILVDTGYELPEAVRIIKYLEALDLHLKGIILTHHHDDHEGNIYLFEQFHPFIWDATNTIDGEIIEVGLLHLEILHTPGHTETRSSLPEDISVYIRENSVLIAGDILFSCLPPMLCYGANPEKLMSSIERLRTHHFKWIIPGHGRITNGDYLLNITLDYISKITHGVENLLKEIPNIQNIDLQLHPDLSLSDCFKHEEWLIPAPSKDLHIHNLEILLRDLKKSLNYVNL